MFNINDENYKKTNSYKNFMATHKSYGSLKIRASAASGAIPISGVKIVVTTNIDNNRIVFYEGVTDESGIIDNISLPAYKLDNDNTVIPEKTEYNVEATYVPDNLSMSFKVNIYENINVVQNINVVPEMRIMVGDIFVS